MKNIFKLILSAFFLTIVLSVFTSASSTDTILTRSNEKIKCSVYFENVPEGSVIVLTPFENGRCGISQFKTVSDKKSETFFINSGTKEVRIFVFDNISSISPLTEGEKIEVKLDSLIDDEWSEWV